MRWLEHLEEGLIAFLMAAMTLVTFMQVVARYVFNYSFVWALELTGVMFACASAPTSAWTPSSRRCRPGRRG